MAIEDCTDDALDIARRSKLEGFPDKQSMSVNRYVFNTLQAVFLVLGLLINFLICFVMVRRNKVKKSLSNFFLFSLSLTELLLWLVVFPVMLVVSASQVETDVPCKVLVFCIFTCAAVMFGLLAAIACDRYINIVSPLRGITLEDHKVAALVIIWIVALATSAPFLFSVEMRVVTMEFQTSPVHPGEMGNATAAVRITMTSLHGGSTNTLSRTTNVTAAHAMTVITGNGSNRTALNSTYNAKCTLPLRMCDIPTNLRGQMSCIIFLVFSFVLPLVLIIMAYGRIVHRLWHRSRSLDAKATAAKAKLRAVRMLILVVLCFLITDGPWIIACLVYSFKPRDLVPLQGHYTVVATATTLFFASAVVTPSIHALHSSTVQREIASILCCRSRESLASTTSSRTTTASKYRAIRFARSRDELTRNEGTGE